MRAPDSTKRAGVLRLLWTYWPKTPEAVLWFRVLESAICDAWPIARWPNLADHEDGKRYLYEDEDIPAAEVCSIDSGWVRRIISEAGLPSCGQ